MKFSDKDLEHLGKLANIDIDPDSREKLVLEMERIIGFVERIQEAPTRDGEEQEGMSGNGARMREDIPSDCIDRNIVLEQAPDRLGGHFRVPPVIDGERM